MGAQPPSLGSFALVLNIIITLVVTVWALSKYARLNKNYMVTALTMVTWFVSGAIVFILPMDVSSAFYWNCVREWYCDGAGPGAPTAEGCGRDDVFYNVTAVDLCSESDSCSCTRPWSYFSAEALPGFWRFIYWTSQLLTWLVLPITQSYLLAGDFTVWGRLKSAIKANVLMYLSLGVIVLILVIYLIVKKHMTSSGLEQLAIASSNTWGLLMVVVLLGYGIVDIPRLMFRRYDRQFTLKRYYFRASRMNEELLAAEDKLEEVYDSIKGIVTDCPRDSSLWHFVQIILSICPFNEDFDTKASSRSRAKKPSSNPITKKGLAKVHARLKNSQLIVKRCRVLFNDMVERAIDLEDVMKQRDKADHRFISSLGNSDSDSGPFGKYAPIMAWWWKVKIRPAMYLVLGVVSTILSAVVLWSEITFFQTNPTISLYAIIIQYVGTGSQFFYLEVVTFLTLFYLSVCTYRLIFRLRIFNLYNLVPRRQTDSASLIFAALMLSRLTTPLCLNFVSMAHLDSHVTTSVVAQPTAFTQVMGHVDFFGFIKDFNTYYPMVILFVSFSTLLRCGSRLLSLCGVSSLVMEDYGAQDSIAEGKLLIRRLKRAKVAKEAGSSRRPRQARTSLRALPRSQSKTRPLVEHTGRLDEDVDDFSEPLVSENVSLRIGDDDDDDDDDFGLDGDFAPSSSRYASSSPMLTHTTTSTSAGTGTSSSNSNSSSSASNRKAGWGFGSRMLGGVKKFLGVGPEEDGLEDSDDRNKLIADIRRTSSRKNRNFRGDMRVVSKESYASSSTSMNGAYRNPPPKNLFDNI